MPKETRAPDMVDARKELHYPTVKEGLYRRQHLDGPQESDVALTEGEKEAPPPFEGRFEDAEKYRKTEE